MIEQQEFFELMARKKREKDAARADVAAFRQMAQAAVAVENLTEQPMWDLFLRYLQAAKEAWEQERDGTLRHVLDATTTDMTMALKMQAIRLEERVRLIDALMGLPKELIAIGEEAKGIAERMEEDGDS